MQRKDGLYGLADFEGAANYRPKLAPFESTTVPEGRISVKKMCETLLGTRLTS